MSDRNLDLMYEAECEADWERQNAEPEIPVHLINSELCNAWCECSDAKDRLAWACEYAKDHPFAAKVESLMDEIERVQDVIKRLQEEAKTL